MPIYPLANPSLTHLLFRWKALRAVIWHFFLEIKKLSEIKPPLGTEDFGNLYLKQLSGVVVYGKYMGDFVQIQLF